MPTRRTMMLCGAAAAMMPLASLAQQRSIDRRAAITAALGRPDTLAYYAARAHMLFGTEIGRNFLDDPDHVRTVINECSLVNATLISARITRTSENSFNFLLGDQEVSFAQDHKLATDGGYLVVHGDEPHWITATTDRSVALAELRRIVSTTMTHYAGQLVDWLVVNEAITPDGLRDCVWLSSIGPDYIAESFRAARSAAPNAMLVLNENHLEDETAGKKQAVVLAKLTSLLNAGVPIDALGLQAHLYGERKIDPTMLGRFLDSVRSLGLKIIVTELDVIDAQLPADIGLRDSIVAQKIAEFLNVVLSGPGVESVTVWGLTDRYSWYNSPHTAPALRRQDGLRSRGTLLDENLRRKPSYAAVQAAFAKVARS